MAQNMDFLKQAVDALGAGNDMAERADNSEHYSDMYMQRSQEWFQRAQTLALLSLAADVRRVADVLESVVEQDGERGISAAVRIWGSGS